MDISSGEDKKQSVIKAFQWTSAKKATSQTDCSLCCSKQELERLCQSVHTEQSGTTKSCLLSYTYTNAHTHTVGYLYLVFQRQASQSLKSNQRAKINIIYFPVKTSTASCDKVKVTMYLWVIVYSFLKFCGIAPLNTRPIIRECLAGTSGHSWFRTPSFYWDPKIPLPGHFLSLLPSLSASLDKTKLGKICWYKMRNWILAWLRCLLL